MQARSFKGVCWFLQLCEPGGADISTAAQTCTLQDIKAHPFFAGVQWETLHAAAAPYIPRVDHELDTQVCVYVCVYACALPSCPPQ